jgi:thiol-disulfide isomerase/thioredoxin
MKLRFYSPMPPLRTWSLLALGLLTACVTPPLTPTVSNSLPAIPLTTTDGKPQLLDDARAHRPALINFWASWCDPCVQELPALSRLAAEAPAHGVVVIGVDVGEKHGKVADFISWHKLSYVTFVDEEFALVDALGVHSVPTTLVVDKDGHIIHHGNALDQAALAALSTVADGK